MQRHHLTQLWAYTAATLFLTDFFQKAAELCRNFVSSRKGRPVTGDAGGMGGAISYAVSFAGLLLSRSVAS